MSRDDPVLVPVSHLGGRLDNDSPTYVFAPDLYLALALGYDSLGAPDARLDGDGVWDPDFTRIQPRLATSWEEEPSGDWLIRLRPGVRSNRGNEWDAEDLAWTFARAAAQDVMAAWRWHGVIGLEAVEPIDRHTVRLRLRTPYPTLPNWAISVSPNMVDSRAIRSHATAEDPWGLAWLDAHLAGYGAYDLETMTADFLSFVARPDYWRGTPTAERIEVRPFGDRAEAIAQLDDSRPVVIVGADPDETRELMAREELRVTRTWAGHVSIELDFEQPPFDDRRVRHALAFATPYEEIRAVGLRGLARPWLSPVKGISQWHLQSPLPYRHDYERARELLAEAGYPQGFETALYISEKPYCLRIAEIISREWSKVGIDVEITSVEGTPDGWLPPVYLRAECAHNVSEPIYDLAHDYAAMHPLLPLPGGPPHVGNWYPRWKKNPEIIEQFVAILLTDDRDEKRGLIEALQRTIIDWGATIFLGEMQQVLVTNAAVPDSLIAPSSRFFQALEYQNATTNYLPRHTMNSTPRAA